MTKKKHNPLTIEEVNSTRMKRYVSERSGKVIGKILNRYKDERK